MTDPETTRDLIEENIRLTKENNKLLRSLRRAQTISAIFKVIWIAVLIGLPFILYVYVLQPYYENVRTQYQEIEAQFGNIPLLNLFFKQEEAPPQE